MGENIKIELEDKVAAIIAEHVLIGYQFLPDGNVDPNTIRVAGANGAAHVVLHFLSTQRQEGER